MKITQKSINPFPYSDDNKRYHTMDYAMRQIFGGKACKIPVDGGFTCPNRDGSKGVGGCTFCSGKGSGEFAAGREYSITEQIERGALMMRKKWNDAALIPYFQSFTGTYAPLDTLKKLYSEALSYPESAGLCISTRPDCINAETALYLKELSRGHEIFVELGLQTVHDSTARSINRCCEYSDFLKACELLEGLRVCVHIINGLPGESKDMMLTTVKKIAELRPWAVKLHLLHILKGTEMEKQYSRGEIEVMEREEYVSLVCDELELLPPETVIERVSGDGAEDMLIAPLWSRKKLVLQNEIDKELFRRNSMQGMKYHASEK